MIWKRSAKGRMMPRMKVDSFASLLALVLLVACSAATLNRIDPPVPVNANTWHQCLPSGGWCPNWTDCPPPGYEKNGCETNANAGPADVGMKFSLDAGADAR